MKPLFLILSIVIIFMSTAITPGLSSAEQYSSELTRKWAAQREAQREKNRLREQRNLEKKRNRDQQMQMLNQIFSIEEDQGGTDVNSVPERRRTAPTDTYADYGDSGYNDYCPNPTNGKYYPDGQPYWGFFPGPLGTAGNSSCVVCKNNKWKGLKHTYCPGSSPN